MPLRRPKRARSGINALKTLVSMRGLAAIDRRTLAGKGLVEWKEQLVSALGGSDAITPQRAALIDLACRTKLYIDCLDRFLLAQETVVNRRKKSVIPALRERMQLVDGFARLLGQIGLDRREKDLGGLPPAWIEKVQPRPVEPNPTDGKEQ
jgi:hypothetical protein